MTMGGRVSGRVLVSFDSYFFGQEETGGLLSFPNAFWWVQNVLEI